MNKIDEDFRKKSALRYPQYTTPAVLDAQAQADRAARASAARPAPVPATTAAFNQELRRPNGVTPETNRINQELRSAAPRAAIDQIKAQNAARAQALQGLRGTPGVPAPVATAAIPPVAPTAAVTPELPAKAPGLGGRIKSGISALRGAAPAAVDTAKVPKWYQPTGAAKALTKAGAAVGKIAAPVALGSTAATVYNTPTSDYAKRFGVDLAQTGGSPLKELGRDLGLRTAGAVSDLANLATFGSLDSMFADKQQGQDAVASAGRTLPATALRGGSSGGAGGGPGGLEPLQAQTGGPPVPGQSYRTSDGRTVTVPAGFSVDVGPDGQPAFSGSAQTVAAAGGGQGLTPLPTANTALRRPDLGTLSSGFNQVNSRSGEINSKFDALAKQIQDLHGSARFGAKGSLATKLLRLEEARADALGQNQGALVNSQGNQVSDLNNRRSTETGLYDIDVGDRSALRRETSEDARARVKAASDALALRQEQSEAALGQISAEAERMYPDDPKAQQAHIDSTMRRLPGIASGELGLGDVTQVTAADRIPVTLRDQANAKGRASDRDFAVSDAEARRLSFGEGVEGTFGKGPGGLGDYLAGALGELPVVPDRTFYREGGENGRILRAEDLTVDQQIEIERRRKALRNKGN